MDPDTKVLWLLVGAGVVVTSLILLAGYAREWVRSAEREPADEAAPPVSETPRAAVDMIHAGAMVMCTVDTPAGPGVVAMRANEDGTYTLLITREGPAPMYHRMDGLSEVDAGLVALGMIDCLTQLRRARSGQRTHQPQRMEVAA